MLWFGHSHLSGGEVGLLEKAPGPWTPRLLLTAAPSHRRVTGRHYNPGGVGRSDNASRDMLERLSAQQNRRRLVANAAWNCKVLLQCRSSSHRVIG